MCSICCYHTWINQSKKYDETDKVISWLFFGGWSKKFNQQEKTNAMIHIIIITFIYLSTESDVGNKIKIRIKVPSSWASTCPCFCGSCQEWGKIRDKFIFHFSQYDCMYSSVNRDHRTHSFYLSHLRHILSFFARLPHIIIKTVKERLAKFEVVKE